MSTIKISELATSNIALTDFFAKADATGVANKNTVQELSNLLKTVDDTAFKGSIAIADVPSENGWYFASESGTYTNCGGLVIDTTDNIAIIIVSGTFDTFNKIDIPVNITIDAIPTENSTNAVESGGVYNLEKSSFIAEVVDDRFKALEIRLFNVDLAKSYYVKNFYKQITLDRVAIIVNDSTTDLEVCRFFRSPRGTLTGIEEVTLAESNSSGITGVALINWDDTASELSASSYDSTTGGIKKAQLYGSEPYKDYVKNFVGVQTDSQISDIKDYGYPIIKQSKNISIQNAVRLVELRNDDAKKYYFIRSIEKERYFAGLFYRWTIVINQADDETSEGITVCRLFYTSGISGAGTEGDPYTPTTPYEDTTFKVETLDSLSSTISGRIFIDWTKIPINTSLSALNYLEGGVIQKTLSLDFVTQNQIFELKSDIKEVVIVDINGNGDYTSLHTAYVAYAGISTFDYQVEFLMESGTYEEINGLRQPPFSTTRASLIGTVKLFADTLGAGVHPSILDPKESGKFIGIIFECDAPRSTDFMYTIHTAPLKDSILIFEDCYANHLGTGDNWALAGDSNGSTMIFKGGGSVSTELSLQHCRPQSGKEIQQVNKFIGYSFGNLFSLGSFGCLNTSRLTFENCTMQEVAFSYNKYNNSQVLTDHPADNREFLLSGGNNKGLYFDFGALNAGTDGRRLVVTSDALNVPITISGTAVDVLFGNYKTIKEGTRINGNIKSYGNVQDIQVGGFSSGDNTLYDLVQMWKRLGDCSVTNKTLTVIVNGVGETYTFNQDYATLQTTEATFLTDLNTAFTHCTFSKESGVNNYDKIFLSEKINLIVADADGILKNELVMLDANGKAVRAIQGANKREVIGIATESKATNELLQVWSGAFKFTGANGEYGVGVNNQLSSSESEKVGYVKNNVFYN